METASKRIVDSYTVADCPLVLHGPYAGEDPLYLALASDSEELLTSLSLTAILQDERIKKPLDVSPGGISFFLQSGVVPPPTTIYENIFVLGIGDSVSVVAGQGRLILKFSNIFPFNRQAKEPENRGTYSEEKLLELLAEAVTQRLDRGRPTFLFQSAGKDSNTIAIALAEAGLACSVTTVTLKARGSDDESSIAKAMSDKMGFRHVTLPEVCALSELQKATIKELCEKAPFPCADHLSLCYGTYPASHPELREANIIDGMGNDVYIGHIPAKAEMRKQAVAHVFGTLASYLPSGNSLSALELVRRTRAECTGLIGLSFSDSERIYDQATDVRPYWRGFSRQMRQLDYFETRARIRGCLIDCETYTRKVRNFVDAFGGRAIFPWANHAVAKYVAGLCPDLLYDRRNLKNKLVLRSLLKRRLGLDSDKLGKLPYSFDLRMFVKANRQWVEDSINQCTLWRQREARKLVGDWYMAADGNKRVSSVASICIYRLLILSLWNCYNCYLKPGPPIRSATFTGV